MTVLLGACRTFVPDKDGMIRNSTPIVIQSGLQLKAMFNYAMPIIGKPIQLTAPYYVEVRNDSLFSYLPYFGRADYLPYGGGKGLDFEAPILRIDGIHNERKQCDIYYIEVQTKEDYHLYELQMFEGSGTVRLDVQSRQRDLIRFEGYKE